MSFDPCKNIREKSDEMMKQIRDASNAIYGPLNDAKNAANDLINNNEDINGLEDDLHEAANNAMSDFNNLVGGLEDLTGDCLTPLTSKVREMIYAGDSMIYEVFGQLKWNLWEMFSRLEKLINIIDISGIASLVRSLDEMLGCLSSSCINEEIQSLFDEVNYILDDIGLTAEGDFDPEGWLTEQVEDVTGEINDRIETIKDVVTDTVDVLQSNVKSIASAIKVPKEFY